MTSLEKEQNRRWRKIPYTIENEKHTRDYTSDGEFLLDLD